jgi:phosphohistidine phosphatase
LQAPRQDLFVLRLYLVRHAIAEEPAETAPFVDAARPLTAKGRRRFRRIAHRLAGLDESIDVIFTGPALRAAQTAELLAAALRRDEVRVLDELRPDGAAALLVERLREVDAGGVALVGHNRQLSDLAALLANLPADEAARLRLKRGTILRIDVEDLRGGAAARPRWWIRPASGAVCKGLPVEAATTRA